MESTNTPFRPFSFEPNDSSSSLSARDMEISISPNASQPPPRFAANYESRDLPKVPNRNPRRSQMWNDVTRTWETVIQESPGSSPQNIGNSFIQPTSSPRPPTFQLPPSPRSPAFRQQGSSPTPPMTKSSQKILQLTGFDPRFERALPIEHQQLSPTQPTRPQPPNSPIRTISSNSSSSFYCQAEMGLRYEQARSRKGSSTSIAQSSNSEGEYLTSSIYNISEHSSKSTNTSRTNVKTKLNNKQAVPLPPSPGAVSHFQTQSEEEEPLPLNRFPISSRKSRDSNEIITLQKILAQEQLRYENRLEKDTSNANKHTTPTTPSIIPSPLTQPQPPDPNPNLKAKVKNKPKHISVVKEKKNSLFRAAKDSLEWGIYDPSISNTNTNSASITTNRTKYPTTPVSPMFSMESDHLTLPPPLGSHSPDAPRTLRKRFGSGSKHPLKSPFPFGNTTRGGATATAIAEKNYDEEADTMPSPSTTRKFKRRVSSTIKHLSLTSPSRKRKTSPPSSRRFVITNAARRADGPATPMPPKHGFMEGVMRGKEVLGKVVGKSGGGGMNREEKRRESLKKRIVVVGITDQSPDGRVAEWL